MDFAALGVAARFAELAGAMMLFGVPLLSLTGFRGEAGRAALRLAWPRGALPLAGLLVLAGAVAALSAQTATMTGDDAQAFRPAALWSVLSGTQYGRGLGARLALAGLALLLTREGPWSRRVLAGLGAAILASFAWTGHGAMDDGPQGAIHLGADIAHLLAAGAWIGALVVFMACAFSRRLRRDEAAVAGLQRGLTQFSGMGSLVVALLLATGLANSWFLIGVSHIGELPFVLYGQVLIAKLALFGVMILLAALNRFVLTPRLARAGSGRTALAGLRWSVGLETLSALVVLGLVAWLGTLAPISMT